KTHGGAAFWRYHDIVFEEQQALDEVLIRKFAAREGVAPEAVDAALATGADGRVAADVRLGEAAGVQGTPAYLVNDWFVTGILPYPEFRALIARALSESKRN